MKKTFRYLGNKCHLVMEFEDDGERFITYKYWRSVKQRWQYMVDSEYLVNAFKEDV